MTELKFSDLTITTNLPAELSAEEKEPGRIAVSVKWNELTTGNPHLNICWSMPVIDLQYQWHPMCFFNRSLNVDWYGPMLSRAASSAPVYSYFNTAGRNRFTLALSDASTPIECSIGVHEEDGTLLCRVNIPLDSTGYSHEYSITVYRDYDDVSFAEALRRVTKWWETDCSMIPAEIPDAARNPLYSFWYSFHQATIAKDVEDECARAKELGIDTVIVDDGWQTEDGSRGYGYCGDWEPAAGKIPDMKAHVANVHKLGMKYVLWFSVPFVGFHSKHWEKFKDKMLCLREDQSTGILDPRYPDVRQYLIDTYVHALKEWDLDGFKLDFFCDFKADPVPAPTPEMDYVLVEPAVIRLMNDIIKALNAVKPGLLIELRQAYIGPVMRTFGNMFRVGDCPDDALSNRVGVIDLRLLSGSTPVHSDMLMWHKDEKPEAAALQILSVIFSVVQISVKLSDISEQHRKLLCFWLEFIKSHRDLLLDTPLEVESPQHFYPVVKARKDGRAVIAVYDSRHIVKIDERMNEIWLLNATGDTLTALMSENDVKYSVEFTDCMGNFTGKKSLTVSGIAALEIPVCGMAHLKAEEA